MKKTMLFISTLLLSILLAGCVSIPLSDGGKLELSKDGVTIDKGDENELETEVIEMAEEDAQEELQEEPQTEREGLEDEGTMEEPKAVETEGTDAVKTATETKVCQEPIEDLRGNERAIKQITELAPPNFPILDCMKINSVNETYSDGEEAVVTEVYSVVEGYWADIYDLYKGYLEESGFGPLKKSEKAQEMSANMTGSTPDYHMNISLHQVERDDDIEVVSLYFKSYHYDTPREQ